MSNEDNTILEIGTEFANKEDLLNYTHGLATRKSLEELLAALKQRKKSFKDKSRMFCCCCFSFCVVIFIIVFYIFDVMKYNASCKQNKRNNSVWVELCDAPSIGFWPRFFFVSISVVLLLFGLYCSGPTVIIFNPKDGILSIDKKKLFCLPSICEYPLEFLERAEIEDDASEGVPNLSTFNFHSVVLIFRDREDNIINLGLGRDCFYRQEKIELKNEINEYLAALRGLNCF